MLRRMAAAVMFAVVSFGSAMGAPLDRGAVLSSLCGEGAAETLTGLRLLLDAAPGLPADDANWGLAVVNAFSAKALRCGADGAFVLAGPPALDASTLQPTSLPAEARAPLPSLRARVVIEQVSAALILFANGSERERLAAIRTLSRRSDGLPSDLLPAALSRAHDPAVVAALRDMQAEAGLHAPDPQRRVAAIQAIADSATSATATRLQALRAEPAFGTDPEVAGALDSAIARVQRRVAIGNALSKRPLPGLRRRIAP